MCFVSCAVEFEQHKPHLSYSCAACLLVAVYSFFLGTRPVGWAITISTIVVQIWILSIFVSASGEFFLFSPLLLFSREYLLDLNDLNS